MIQFSTSYLNLVHKLLAKYPQIIEVIREEKYKVSDTELSYRQITILDQSNLLKERRDKDNEWRSFNLNDLLYLHIISQSKQFKISHKRLNRFKDDFYKNTLDLVGVGKLYNSEIALIGLISELVPLGILIFGDGESIFTDEPSIVFSQGYKDPSKRTFVFIMLYETYSEAIKRLKTEDFTSRFDLSDFEDDYQLIPNTRQEQKILKTFKDEDVKALRVEKKPDKTILIEGERYFPLPDLNELSDKELINIIRSGKYTDYLIVKEPNKIKKLRITDKVKA